jgi:prepilin-type N-terminal cleavage/methylation domain-containing protein
LVVDKQRAFTLVELLVVLGIIALLMSILIPVLAKARRQAKAVACISNLRQWAAFFSMYTLDSDGYFMLEPAYYPDGSVMPGEHPEERTWYSILWPYHRERKLYLCPLATRPEDEGGRNPFSAWGLWDDDLPYGRGFEDASGEKYLYGSYGMNYWILNPQSGQEPSSWIPWLSYFWRNANARGANQVPLLLDCQWTGVEPVADAPPPEYDGDVADELTYCEDDMKRVCLNRQRNGTTNGAFMDFSVRKIGLKELWELRWHRHWIEDRARAGEPEWPRWMRNFKDYAGN